MVVNTARDNSYDYTYIVPSLWNCILGGIKMKILLPILLVGIIFISGCINQTSNQIEPTGEIKEFELTAKQWEFSPNTITVNRGDIVKIHIESVDVTHGFALPDFGVNEILEPGNDIHVDFVADKVGTFTFFCSVSCGSGHSGMNGQLIVK
jgi:cytochrome c oxidase subunit 2